MRLLKRFIFFIGLICFVVGAAGVLWVVGTRDVKGSATPQNINLVKTVPSAGIRSLDIRTDISSIVFTPGTGSDIQAHFTGTVPEADKDNRAVTLTAETRADGALIVRASSSSRSFFHIGVDFAQLVTSLASGNFSNQLQLEILLPQQTYDSVAVHSDTGRILLGDMQAGTLEASADTGAIELNSFRGKTLKLHTDTGAIDFHNVSATECVTADTGTGRVKGSLTALASSVALKADTGAVQLELPADASALLDLSTSVGHIGVNGGAGIVYGEKRKHHIAAKLGAAAHRVGLEAGTGSITVNIK